MRLLGYGHRCIRTEVGSTEGIIVIKKSARPFVVNFAIENVTDVAHRCCEVESQPASVNPIRRIQSKIEIVVELVFKNDGVHPVAFVTSFLTYTFVGQPYNQVSYRLLLFVNHTKVPGAGLPPADRGYLGKQAPVIRTAPAGRAASGE